MVSASRWFPSADHQQADHQQADHQQLLVDEWADPSSSLVSVCS
jgi:hypothetical protein